MAINMATRLKIMREQDLKVSREKLARRTSSVSTGTVRNAEYGARITFGKAGEILNAVNSLRSEKGLSEVTIEDLGLTLY